MSSDSDSFFGIPKLDLRSAVIHTLGSLSIVSNILNSVATSSTDSCDSSRVIISLCLLRHPAAQFSPALLFILSSHYLSYPTCLSTCKPLQFSFQNFIVWLFSVICLLLLCTTVGMIHRRAPLLTNPHWAWVYYALICLYSFGSRWLENAQKIFFMF